jgi:hypothetical protein
MQQLCDVEPDMPMRGGLSRESRDSSRGSSDSSRGSSDSSRGLRSSSDSEDSSDSSDSQQGSHDSFDSHRDGKRGQMHSKHHDGDDQDDEQDMDPEQFLQMTSCLLQNFDEVDAQCVDVIQQEGFTPVLQCSTDLLNTCANPGGEVDDDIQTQVRCMRDNMQAFTPECQQAVQNQWNIVKASNSLAEMATPTDYDVYTFLHVPNKPMRGNDGDDGHHWAHHPVFFFVSALLFLIFSVLVLICCVRRCRKRRAAAQQHAQLPGAQVLPSPSSAAPAAAYRFSNSVSVPYANAPTGQSAPACQYAVPIAPMPYPQGPPGTSRPMGQPI